MSQYFKESVPPTQVYSKINLRKLYPISALWPLMRSFSWLSMFIFSVILVFYLDYKYVSTIENDVKRNLFHLIMVTVLLGTFSVWLGRFIVFALERWYYDYRIDSGHLYVVKGIFLKQKGSFPLARITDIYLDRSLLDFIFGLWDVHVSTPTASSGEFAHIPGLTSRNATNLQKKLSELVHAQAHDLPEFGTVPNHLSARKPPSDQLSPTNLPPKSPIPGSGS